MEKKHSSAYYVLIIRYPRISDACLRLISESLFFLKSAVWYLCFPSLQLNLQPRFLFQSEKFNVKSFGGQGNIETETTPFFQKKLFYQ